MKLTAKERHLDPCRVLMGDARKSRWTRLPKICTKIGFSLLHGIPVIETRFPSNTTSSLHLHNPKPLLALLIDLFLFSSLRKGQFT